MKKYLFIIIILLPILLTAQKSLPGGYGNLNWGTKLSSAKDSVKGKIIFTDEKKVIISHEGELQYYYGFFYEDPELLGKDKESEKENEKAEDEGKLFYITLKFPMISLNDIIKKYKDKYGDPTRKNLKKNRGAIAWDSDKTIIILWIDNYEDHAYCGRVVYVSKDIAKELKNYTDKIFNSVEKEMIEKLAK